MLNLLICRGLFSQEPQQSPARGSLFGSDGSKHQPAKHRGLTRLTRAVTTGMDVSPLPPCLAGDLQAGTCIRQGSASLYVTLL